jgi:hypothetical protein
MAREHHGFSMNGAAGTASCRHGRGAPSRCRHSWRGQPTPARRAPDRAAAVGSHRPRAPLPETRARGLDLAGQGLDCRSLRPVRLVRGRSRRSGGARAQWSLDRGAPATRESHMQRMLPELSHGRRGSPRLAELAAAMEAHAWRSSPRPGISSKGCCWNGRGGGEHTRMKASVREGKIEHMNRFLHN